MASSSSSASPTTMASLTKSSSEYGDMETDSKWLRPEEHVMSISRHREKLYKEEHPTPAGHRVDEDSEDDEANLIRSQWQSGHRTTRAMQVAGIYIPPVPLVPRAYQLELFERACKRNVIAVLDTGAGKTLVAIMLLREMYAREQIIRKAREMHGRKVSVCQRGT